MDGEAYTATATISIKDTSVSVPLSFTVEISGDEALMSGTSVVSRTPLDLGQESDPSADWVSENVDVNVTLVAVRADGR